MISINHVITNFSGIGGAELMLIRLINSTPNVRHRVISLMSISDDLTHKIDNKNVEYLSLNSKGMLSMFFSSFRLAFYLRRNESKIISWMYHACVISSISSLFLKKGRSHYFNIRHSLDALESEKISTRISIYACKYLSRYSSGNIYCSSKAMNQHQNLGFFSGNSIYIPNGYTFTHDDYPKRSHTKERFVIGMLGRFNEAKDFNNLLKSFKKTLSCYPDAFLKIGGKGVDHKNVDLMKIIDDLNIPRDKLELLGPVTDVNSFYRSLDLYVLSSRNEAFPNVLVEAMSNSLPVVSTNVGDASLIIDNNDYLVPPSDSEKLSNRILEFIGMSEIERDSIGKRNKELVLSNYSIEYVSDMYLSLR
ncbi:glycosyltransferase [Vibrio diabolicus]|uniref:glycosyltransferase n=1 Tax=Vibrio diabolicus TaxID=50719 RepID=UPI00211CB209|nr:glycosyltransferase [Vibrio diabolicus]MCQ9246394.1 glycosyltransferase [Vibrio diabolicus]